MHKIEEIDLQSASYAPNVLLNKAAEKLGAKNDAQLAHVLECDPGLLCKMRSRAAPLTPWIFLQIMDRTGWHIQYVRGLAGIPFEGRAEYAQLVEEAHAALAQEGIAPEPPAAQWPPLIEYAGQARTLRDWSRHLGIAYTTLWSRQHSGLTDERLFKVKRPNRPRQHNVAQHSTAQHRAG